MEKEKLQSIGVRMLPETWELCSAMAEKCGDPSRNDFIRKAVNFYIEYLNHEKTAEFLTPALESVIDGKIKDSEERLARLLFKLAVDQNFLAHIVGGDYRYDDAELETIRRESMDEVRKTNGTVSIVSAFKNGFNRG